MARRWGAGVVLTVAAALAGCGVELVPAAADRIGVSAHDLQSGSYRYSLDIGTSIDASHVTGLPGSSGSLGSTDHQSGTAEVASSRRVRVTEHHGSRTTTIVTFDGALFVSTNGTDFALVGDFGNFGDTAGPADLATLLGAATPSEVGQESVDGQQTLHDRLAIDGATYERLLPDFRRALSTFYIAALGPSGANFAQQLLDAIHIEGGTLDIWMGATDSHPVRARLTLVERIDARALLTAVAGSSAGPSLANVSGDLIDTATETTDYRDFGAAVSISKPTVDRTLQQVLTGG